MQRYAHRLPWAWTNGPALDLSKPLDLLAKISAGCRVFGCVENMTMQAFWDEVEAFAAWASAVLSLAYPRPSVLELSAGTAAAASLFYVKLVPRVLSFFSGR